VKTSLHKNTIWLPFLLAALALASLACMIGSITINNGVATVEVILTEAQLNNLLVRNLDNLVEHDRDELLDRITAVEFHDGYLRVLGENIEPDGAEVPGNFDVRFGAEDDALVAEIFAVRMPGVGLDDPRIVAANEELAEALGRQVTRSNGQVLFKEAAVKDGALWMKIEVGIGD
jgi:hypothetical protein